MKPEFALFFLRTLTGLAFGVALSACAPGSGEGLNVSGRPVGEGGDVPLAATLESIQVNVFDASCTLCHSGAAAPLGLRLDAGNSFTNLVGVPSAQVGSLLRVDPGDPDSSYLVRKLEGTASEGQLMPLGGPPIPQATIDFVRQWISDGALPEGGGTPGTAPVVVSMSPTPDSVGPDFPAEIVVGFDQEIDASTVNELTFTLTRAGGDGAFGDAADVTVAPAAVSLSAVNARLAIMDLTSVPPLADLYRVTLEGSGPNMILGVDGRALDGEFSGALPSGDGVQGGDFVADFEVQGLQASLDSIQANVFAVSCAFSGCHSGPAGPGLPTGLDLTSADASFAVLVGVASVEVPTVLRVTPGDPDASYLVRKLEGTAAVGGQMPAGSPPLDQATIDVIRAWINSGAAR
jgi:hypothetical protein